MQREKGAEMAAARGRAEASDLGVEVLSGAYSDFTRKLIFNLGTSTGDAHHKFGTREIASACEKSLAEWRRMGPYGWIFVGCTLLSLAVIGGICSLITLHKLHEAPVIFVRPAPLGNRGELNAFITQPNMELSSRIEPAEEGDVILLMRVGSPMSVHLSELAKMELRDIANVDGVIFQLTDVNEIFYRVSSATRTIKNGQLTLTFANGDSLVLRNDIVLLLTPSEQIIAGWNVRKPEDATTEGPRSFPLDKTKLRLAANSLNAESASLETPTFNSNSQGSNLGPQALNINPIFSPQPHDDANISASQATNSSASQATDSSASQATNSSASEDIEHLKALVKPANAKEYAALDEREPLIVGFNDNAH